MEAFGNYVLVHYLNHENHIEKNIIRNSFSVIGEQLETIEKMKRIHRSYIVNIDKVINLEMRNRKATVKIKFIDEMIPVSKASLIEIQTFLNSKK
ncbi:MAG: LytTR family transcriptional regulator DNA-binding domain-containing protein [Flavobacterium sp.]|uniref:LytTR family transcriptional regulator DNA-binding domain-containing protein n=1 Tax=Flavobacterium sp. TaxID=239 RepID=UPI0037AEB2ED